MKYRPNVCAIIQNQYNKILIIKDAGTTEWKFPQGGREPGESDEQALWREMKEELNLTEAELVGWAKKRNKYEWPKRLRKNDGLIGQKQRICALKADKRAIKRNPKYVKATRWVTIKKARRMLRNFRHDPLDIIQSEGLLTRQAHPNA